MGPGARLGYSTNQCLREKREGTIGLKYKKSGRIDIMYRIKEI